MWQRAKNIALIIGFLGLVRPASAASSLCDAAAAEAAQKTGVPLNVLLALTRTETGRSIEGQFQPWPWTVNMEGKGRWFPTKKEALNFVKVHHAAGARSFDVGCFQVNYKWHGQGFKSLSDMFDPEENAIYAANFLLDLKGRTSDWSDAAGAYHSKTPDLKTRYQARFDNIFTSVQSQKIKMPTQLSFPANNYPLFQKGQASGSLGSLFQGQSHARKPLFSVEGKS